MTDLQKQELTNLGFQQDSAKRGVITWIFAILAVLLFGSVTLNILQEKSIREIEGKHGKELKEINAAYNGVLLEMLHRTKELEGKVDTVIQKKL